jgi:hypothetical protein
MRQGIPAKTTAAFARGERHVQEEIEASAAPGLLMPSTSAKQKRFMAAAAHDKDFAKKAGIPQTVAKEFVAADQRMAPEKHGYLKVTKARG